MSKKQSKVVIDTLPLTKLTQNEKMNIIAQMIVNGSTKKECINYIIENFKHPSGESYEYDGAYVFYRQCFAYIYQQSLMEKEELRKTNMARLEQIYDEAIDQNARITEKLKTIDLINKTMNLYTQDINVNQGDNTFKFDLNLGNDNEKK